MLTTACDSGLNIARCLQPGADYIKFYEWVRAAVAGARRLLATAHPAFASHEDVP